MQPLYIYFRMHAMSCCSPGIPLQVGLDEVHQVLGGSPSKSLRYGSCLHLTKDVGGAPLFPCLLVVVCLGFIKMLECPARCCLFVRKRAHLHGSVPCRPFKSLILMVMVVMIANHQQNRTCPPTCRASSLPS